jgi:hypothetical protein
MSMMERSARSCERPSSASAPKVAAGREKPSRLAFDTHPRPVATRPNVASSARPAFRVTFSRCGVVEHDMEPEITFVSSYRFVTRRQPSKHPWKRT